MKAARFYAEGDIRVEDVDVSQTSEEKVLVAVEWCGICGSDLVEYLGGPLTTPSEKTGPHVLTGETVPITMGHEFSGRVVHAPATSSFVPGQPVVADPRHICRSCNTCTGAASNCCRNIGFIGISGGGGGFSEMVAVSPKMLHPLPDKVDLAAASLIEPLAVAWHAVKHAARLLPSGTGDFAGIPILVVGGGPVGVAIIFALKALGANMILVSETAAKRRKVLAGFVSPKAIYNPIKVDIGARCRELTGGDGVSIVFDCAGSQAGLEAACDSLKFHGIYVNLAIPKKPIVFPSLLFAFKELTLRSMLAYDERDFEEAVAAFVAGRFEGVERMITSRITVDDIVEKGFQELIRNPDRHFKIIVTPKGKSTQSKLA